MPGVEDGMTVRVPDSGDAPVSGKGPAGDLLVRVRVTPSKQFQRKGDNLYHEARIPMHSALLGGRVRVPTLDGDVDVRVPSGTQQGEEMVLKGRGVQSVFNGKHGDLFVTFRVVLPRYEVSVMFLATWNDVYLFSYLQVAYTTSTAASSGVRG